MLSTTALQLVYCTARDGACDVLSTISRHEVDVLMHVISVSQDAETRFIVACTKCHMAVFTLAELKKLLFTLRREVLEAKDDWNLTKPIGERHCYDRTVAASILDRLISSMDQEELSSTAIVVLDDCTNTKCGHPVLKANRTCALCGESGHKYLYTTIYNKREVYACHKCHKANGGTTEEYTG